MPGVPTGRACEGCRKQKKKVRVPNPFGIEGLADQDSRVTRKHLARDALALEYHVSDLDNKSSNLKKKPAFREMGVNVPKGSDVEVRRKKMLWQM
jgi:hypothetical protein